MVPRKEGEVVPQGWSYTNCTPHGRMHVVFRKGDLFVRIAFRPKDAANPMKWVVEDADYAQEAEPIKHGETVCRHFNSPFDCNECRAENQCQTEAA
jgi:hypothetical protein